MGAAADRPPSRAAVRPTRRGLVDLTLVLAGGLCAAGLLDPDTAALATLWAAAVLVVVRADLDRFIIPDAASAGIAALGLVQGAAAAWRTGEAPAPALLAALSGGAVAFAALWLVALVYRLRSGREGLGFGDVKLAGASGVWLTLPQQVATLELACVAAIAVVVLGARRGPSTASRGAGLRRRAVPFGAFLAPAAWLVFVAGEKVATLVGGAS